MKRAQRNREAFWSAKVSAAVTPADRAAVEWDRTRAAVDDLPRDRQGQAWAAVCAGLEKLRRSVTDGEFTSAVHIGSAHRGGPYA